MGAAGAAIGTVLAGIVNLLILIGFILHQRIPFVLEFSKHFRWTKESLQNYLIKCFPIICNEVLIGVGNMMINVVLGRQSEQAIAAVAVFRTMEGLVIAFFSGFSNAASILVGKEVGAGNHELAFERAKRLVYLCSAIISIACLTLLLVHNPLLHTLGLSGKSFIPMLIGSGCGVPGVMASRTIESDRDRKMTIMTTTFIPCGAKLPIIALIAGAFFDNAGWVAWSAYFVGVAAIVCSGIILKKTKMFAGDPAPFVMELPAYHWPTVGNVLRSMWERGWSFIKKAGTIITLSTIILWFLMNFGWTDAGFGMLSFDGLEGAALEAAQAECILAKIGSAIGWIFTPLGWTQSGNGWKMAVAAISGLIAKENVVATFGMLFGFAEVAEDGTEFWGNLAAVMTPVAAYGYLVFNLLCAPCFAAMGAIKREMNNTKWFWFAIGYQCGLAYVVSLCIYQIGTLITTGTFGIGTVVAFVLVIGLLYLLFRPYKESDTLKVNVKGMAGAR